MTQHTRSDPKDNFNFACKGKYTLLAVQWKMSLSLTTTIDSLKPLISAANPRFSSVLPVPLLFDKLKSLCAMGAVWKWSVHARIGELRHSLYRIR